jgi:inosine/xanthosine triphosphatase
VKLEAAASAWCRLMGHVETVGVSVDSGVSDQPFGDKETLDGAIRRANNIRRHVAELGEQESAFVAAIEGGVFWQGDELHCMAWAVVGAPRSIRSTYSTARSCTFQLPPDIAKLVADGVELGHADDRVFGRVNSKHETGTIGALTNDALSRTELYEQVMMCALVPFVNRNQLYTASSSSSSSSAPPPSEEHTSSR